MDMDMDTDPLRAAVSFLKPCLAHFGFRPVSHALAMDRLLVHGQCVDKEMKVRIIRHECRNDMERATTVYLDWLLATLPSEPDALCPFLQALRSGPLIHVHLHHVLCVTSVYLEFHRPLLHQLSQRLQQGSVQMHVLLPLLEQRGLLDSLRAPQLLNMVGSGSGSGSEGTTDTNNGCSGSEEMFARAAAFLLVCLYSRQAEILCQTYSQTRVSDDRTSSRVNPVRTDTPMGGDDVTDDVMQEAGQASSSTTGTPPGTDDDVMVSLKSLTGDPDRWDPKVLESLQGEPERWPELLTAVLSIASVGEREWPRALCPQDVQSLWDSAGGLIQSGMRNSTGQGQAGTTNNDDASSETGSNDSAVTLRPNPLSSNNTNINNVGEATAAKTLAHGDNNLDQDRSSRVLAYMKHVRDYTEAFNVESEDIASVSSIETNSRLKGRRLDTEGAVGSGVLREEEMRALKGGPIQLRAYQDELLAAARERQNVLIWLPTGTGKTYIVLKYAEEHLEASPDHCVAFVVPKVRLARQQYERFLAYLPRFKPHLKCGETSGTASGRQPLGEVLKTSRVVVITGQSLVEAVDKGRVSLGQFSLLVLDECHHTRGGHPLRVLMNHYMTAKFDKRSPRLPQVMGLTASPGVGKARGKEVDDAVKYLKQLCARLDVSFICNVRQNLAELKSFVHVPQADVRECEKRKKDALKERLDVLMKIIEDRMQVDCELEKYLDHVRKDQQSEGHDKVLRNHLSAPADHRGEDQYTQWLSSAEKTLKQVNYPKAFYSLTAHIDMLRRCQRCLILNEDCDSLGALQLLKDEVVAARREKPPSGAGGPNTLHPVDETLFDLVEKNINVPSLQGDCCRKDCQNPKLKQLEDLLLNSQSEDPKVAPPAVQVTDISRDSVVRNPQFSFPPSLREQEVLYKHPCVSHDDYFPEEECDSEVASLAGSLDLDDAGSVTGSDLDHLEHVRGMIFVRTLDLSKALLSWMNRHPKLRHLNPDRITGVNASVKSGGMTKSDVTEVMSKFNSGKVRVVICTSAAEEGLDFKACNFVMRYLYEASMVSMIQIRGRARDENSRYSVLGRQNTAGKEKDNMTSELAMREAVVKIQNGVDRDPVAHHEAIQRMQQEAWKNRWRKDVDERKRLQQRLEPGMYRLLCRKCRQPACTSEEIRILRRTNRVVIGAEFSNKYERKDDHSSDRSRVYDNKIPRTGKIHCKKCGSYWGILVRSVDDGVEFPVLPIKSFLVESANSGEATFIDKWSQAFSVPEISEQDRHRHSEPLLGPEDPLEGDVEPEDDQEEDVEGQGEAEASQDPQHQPAGDAGETDEPGENQEQASTRERSARPEVPERVEVIPDGGFNDLNGSSPPSLQPDHPERLPQ